MDYSLSIWSIATYIEANIKNDINYEDLEQLSGFTYRHLRTITKSVTGMSLSNYILNRRIAYAAFDIIHSSKPITDIAFEYNFNSYDAFARSFKRVTGKSPKAFRSGNYKVGNRRIIMGFYGPEIYMDEDISFLHPKDRKEETMEKHIEKNQSSCILFGVPKVAYTYEECTPLPTSMKAALNYMGDNIDYTYLMAAMGAAFRLRWNVNYWDGGNVDVLNIYENQFDVLDHAFKACKRDYDLLIRSESSKEAYKERIVREIDAGRPVLALGIIGPPEACVVTGYRDGGDTLLGWNCFQESKEMATDVTFHDCGYFITNQWWENPNTVALITIGEKTEQGVTQKEILENAVAILSANEISVKNSRGQVRDTLACGQAAYDRWAHDILDESQFAKDLIMPLQIEKLMCQGDAQTMVSEGRTYAACFMDWIARTNPHIEEECKEVAQAFRASVENSTNMFKLRGGFQQSAEVLSKFMQRDIREKTAVEINEAKKHELHALNIMKDIVTKL